MVNTNMKLAKLNEISVGGKGTYGIAASAVDRCENLYTYLRITDICDDGTLNRSGLKSVDDPDAAKYILKPNDTESVTKKQATGDRAGAEPRYRATVKIRFRGSL